MGLSLQLGPTLNFVIIANILIEITLFVATAIFTYFYIIKKFKELELDLKLIYGSLALIGFLNMTFALIPYIPFIELLRYTGGIVNTLYFVFVLVFLGKVKVAKYAFGASFIIAIVGVFVRPFFILYATIMMIILGISFLYLLIKTHHIIVIMISLSYIFHFIGMMLIRQTNYYTIFAVINVILASLYVSFYMSIGHSSTSALYIWLYTFGQTFFISNVIYLIFGAYDYISALYQIGVLIVYAALIYNAFILTLVYNRRKDKPSKYLSIALIAGSILVLLSAITYTITSLVPVDLQPMLDVIKSNLYFLIRMLLPVLMGAFALAGLNLKQAKWAPTRGESIIALYVGSAITIVGYDLQLSYLDALIIYTGGLVVLLIIGLFEFIYSAYLLYKNGKKSKAYRSLIIPMLFVSLYTTEVFQRSNLLILGSILYIIVGLVSLYYSPRFRYYLAQIRSKEVKV